MLQFILYTGAVAAAGSYTESSLPMHIIDLNCTGNEQSLFDCPQNAFVGIHSCNIGSDASLICQGVTTNLLCTCLYNVRLFVNH